MSKFYAVFYTVNEDAFIWGVRTYYGKIEFSPVVETEMPLFERYLENESIL